MSTETGIAKTSATVDVIGAMQPLVNTAQPRSNGSKFGRNVYTGERFDFDPLQLQKDGEVGGPVVIFLGDRGCTKTTALKELGLLLPLYNAGLDRPGRVAVDVVRLNDAINEWEEFARAWGVNDGTTRWEELARDWGTFSVPMHLLQLNPLARSLKLPTGRLTAWFRDSLDYLTDPLPLVERVILNAGVRRVVELRDSTTDREYDISDLATEIDDMTPRDVTNFVRKATGIKSGKTSLSTSDVRVKSAKFDRAKTSLLLKLALMMQGEFDQVFGNNSDVAEIFALPAQIFNYAEMSDTIIPVIQSLVWEVRDAAEARRDYDLTIEYEFHDETSKLLRPPLLAKRLELRMKTIRGKRSRVIAMTGHRLKDFTAMGANDSELRNTIANILEEPEIVFIGRLRGKRSRRDIAEWRDLDEDTMNRIALQQPGQFCVLIGDGDPIFIERDLDDFLAKISESNQANPRTPTFAASSS